VSNFSADGMFRQDCLRKKQKEPGVLVLPLALASGYS